MNRFNEELELDELLELLSLLEEASKKDNKRVVTAKEAREQQKAQETPVKPAEPKKKSSHLEELEILVDAVVDVASISLKRVSENSELVNAIAVLDANVYKAYMRQGFSKEEALELVIANKKMLSRLGK